MNNVVTITGNLTREVELRYTPTGVAVAKFGLAVNRLPARTASPDAPVESDFFDVTAWRELGENVAESLPVGARVIVTGRLKQDRWEDDAGENGRMTQARSARRSTSWPMRSGPRSGGPPPPSPRSSGVLRRRGHRMTEWSLTHADRIVPANRFRNMHHFEKAAITGTWRKAFGYLALEAGIPPLQQIGVRVQVSLTKGRQMDVDAATVCAKAAIDGLVDAGVLPDDRPPYVAWITFCAPVIRCENDLLTLTVTEVGANTENLML